MPNTLVKSAAARHRRKYKHSRSHRTAGRSRAGCVCRHGRLCEDVARRQCALGCLVQHGGRLACGARPSRRATETVMACVDAATPARAAAPAAATQVSPPNTTVNNGSMTAEVDVCVGRKQAGQHTQHRTSMVGLQESTAWRCMGDMLSLGCSRQLDRQSRLLACEQQGTHSHYRARPQCPAP